MDKLITQYGPRTIAFHGFTSSMEGAYELADLIRRGGIQKLTERQAEGDTLTQRLAGINMQSFINLAAAEKAKYNQQAAAEENEAMNKLAAEVDKTVGAATKTVPHVLFVFEVTVFEAYLENIAAAIFQTNAGLLAKIEGKKASQRSISAGMTVPERVHQAFYMKSWERIAIEIFATGLSIPFAEICQAANTSPTELDKAKAIRNIHIHNSGLIDDKFKKRIGDHGLTVGDYYPIELDYVLNMNTKMYLVALGLDITATTVYSSIPRA